MVIAFQPLHWNKSDPHIEQTWTMVIIVRMVAVPNTPVTRTTPEVLFLAEGYMIRGISGSQGPNTNMV